MTARQAWAALIAAPRARVEEARGVFVDALKRASIGAPR